jgi:hypothetical protein
MCRTLLALSALAALGGLTACSSVKLERGSDTIPSAVDYSDSEFHAPWHAITHDWEQPARQE